MTNVNQTDASCKRKCSCGLIAQSKVVIKEGPNKGRQFYACMRTSSRCQYFEWDDEQPTNVQSSTSSGITCYKCGKVKE
jgi:DNA topoisomerase-3